MRGAARFRPSERLEPARSVGDGDWTNAVMENDDLRHHIFRMAKNRRRRRTNQCRENWKIQPDALLKRADVMTEF